MGRHDMEYFCNAYKKENKIGNHLIRRSLINTIPLGEDESNSILRNITKEEVKLTMFSMKANMMVSP